MGKILISIFFPKDPSLSISTPPGKDITSWTLRIGCLKGAYMSSNLQILISTYELAALCSLNSAFILE